MRRTITGTIFCLALGLLFNKNIGYAADELLAKAELDRAGEKVVAELWGTPINGGYMDDLTVIFKNADKSIITAYKPSLSGGYSCLLKPVNVIGKNAAEQLLLSVGQGSWIVPSNYRILDYDKKGKVTEIFGGQESLGNITNIEFNDENKIAIFSKNSDKNDVEIFKEVNDVEKKRISFDGLYSLVPFDFDSDGIDELFLTQEIKTGSIILADVGYMLKYDQEKKTWNESLMTIRSENNEDKISTINAGRVFDGGIFMPRKLVLPFGECTYPEFSCSNVETENKINNILKNEVQLYLPNVFKGTEDLAFNILRADSKLLSLQFIKLQLVNGKKVFRHHNLNIDPATCKVIKLDSILNLKSKKLVSTMRELVPDEFKQEFDGIIPEEWYIVKDELHLVQKNSQGKDRVIAFSLEDLEEFIIDKKWIVEKPKEEPKIEKEKTAEEKFWEKLIEANKKVESSADDSGNDAKIDSADDENTKAEKKSSKKMKEKSNKKEKLTDQSVISENKSKNKKKREIQS